MLPEPLPLQHEQIYALSSPVPSKPCHAPPWKTKKSWWGTETKSPPTPKPNITNNWIQSYIKKSWRIPNWCRNADPLNVIQVQTLASRQAACGPSGKAQLVEHSILPWCAEMRRFPPPPFKGCQDIWVKWWDEMVVLALALQQCAIQSRMPPGMLCRAVQEFHRCLAPLLEKGDELDISVLDMVEKDPVTPSILTERTSSPEQK